MQRLRTELAEANASVEQMVTDLHAWEAAVAARDAELTNLQVSGCGPWTHSCGSHVQAQAPHCSCDCAVWQHGTLIRPASSIGRPSACQRHDQMFGVSVHGALDSTAASGLAAQFLGMNLAPVLPCAASAREAVQSSCLAGRPI